MLVTISTSLLWVINVQFVGPKNSVQFKKMLNKELSQFTDGGRNAKQISEYICSTFLDSKEVEGTSATDNTMDNAYPSPTDEIGSQDNASRKDFDKSANPERQSTVGLVGTSLDADQASGDQPYISDNIPQLLQTTNGDETVISYGVLSNYPKQLETVGYLLFITSLYSFRKYLRREDVLS